MQWGDPADCSAIPQGDFDVVYDNNGKTLEACKPLIDNFKVRPSMRPALHWRCQPHHAGSKGADCWLLARCCVWPQPLACHCRTCCARWRATFTQCAACFCSLNVYRSQAALQKTQLQCCRHCIVRTRCYRAQDTALPCCRHCCFSPQSWTHHQLLAVQQRAALHLFGASAGSTCQLQCRKPSVTPPCCRVQRHQKLTACLCVTCRQLTQPHRCAGQGAALCVCRVCGCLCARWPARRPPGRGQAQEFSGPRGCGELPQGGGPALHRLPAPLHLRPPHCQSAQPLHAQGVSSCLG